MLSLMFSYLALAQSKPGPGRCSKEQHVKAVVLCKNQGLDLVNCLSYINLPNTRVLNNQSGKKCLGGFVDSGEFCYMCANNTPPTNGDPTDD